MGGLEDALTDQAAIGTGHPGFLSVLPAGDHQSCGDLQFTQHITLLVSTGIALGGFFIERVGIECLDLAGRATRRQASAKGARLTPAPGESLTRCTVSPRRAANSP